LRRVISLNVQGLGQVTFTVHEDEIKRFHREFQEWVGSAGPRKIFMFHVGQETKVIRLDMVASYSIPDEVMAQMEAQP
jgi:hypothetical protein